MKEHFLNELRHLLNMICAQGGQVEQMIQRAIEAVSVQDAAMAAKVIATDSTIDAEEIRIEEECLKTLALYQPVAGDLRTVVAILKINTALERMADFGVHIAEREADMASHGAVPGLERVDFTAMEHTVLAMLRDSLDVMKHSDPVLAYSVIEKDDEVDRAHQAVMTLARSGIRRLPEHAGYYVDCIGISRDLERIADMSVDICEHVIYLHTGKIIRHRAGK